MNEERVSESPPSTGALLEGLDKRGACLACEIEAKLGEGQAQVSTPAHTCGKATSLTVGQRVTDWALTGQPGAVQGIPAAPPGTVLAR